MSLSHFLNGLDHNTLEPALTKCCAASRWVAEMANSRPFQSDQHALETAGVVWNALNRDDWLEAFAAHPKIGDLDSLRAKYANTGNWASSEQAGVAGGGESTLGQLSELNRDYERKFGYIFIVCATGKSADEMLSILKQRMVNEPDEEVLIAAAEQLKITKLRLEKLAI